MYQGYSLRPPPQLPPHLVRFRVGPQGAVQSEQLIHVQHSAFGGVARFIEGASPPAVLVLTAPKGPEHDVRQLAFSADGQLLPIEGLRDNTFLHLIGDPAGGYAALYMPPGLGARPYFFARFDAGGRLRAQPVKLPPSFPRGPAPPPFADFLAAKGDSGFLMRHDGAGMPIGHSVHYGRNGGVVWVGTHFLAVTRQSAANGTVLAARTVTCDPGPPPGR